MYFSTIMLGIGLAIIIATALGGLIYWGRHVRKSASLLFKRYVAGSKEVKDVSFKILQRVIEVGNSRHDHVGNVDKVWESRLFTHTHTHGPDLPADDQYASAQAIAIRITVTRTAVCLLLGNLSVIQAESILRDIVDRCAGPDAISTINLAREALMYRKPGVDLGG